MILFNKKKAQGSVEFVLLAAIMFMVFIGIFLVIQSRIAGAYKDRLYNAMDGLGRLISTEVRLAYSTPGDYSRVFSIPWVVGGYNYTINLYNSTDITISAEGLDYILFLDYNVSGAIGKGKNLIKKIDDNVSITALG